MVLLEKITFRDITTKAIIISAFVVSFATKNAFSADEQNGNLQVAKKNIVKENNVNNLPSANIPKQDDKSTDFLQKTTNIGEIKNIKKEQKTERKKPEINNIVVKQQLENKKVDIKKQDNQKQKTVEKDKNIEKENTNKNKMFENFNLARSINFVLDNVKFENFHFIETDSDLILLRQTLLAQEIQEHQKKIKDAKGKQVSFNSIKLNSLLYFGPKDWKMKLNGELIKPETQSSAHPSVIVVSVNKTSVAFILKNSTSTLIQKINDIKEKKYPYYQNYHIITKDGKQYIMFKLFIGQMIDLDSLLFSG